jgi:hypothetical protein
MQTMHKLNGRYQADGSYKSTLNKGLLFSVALIVICIIQFSTAANVFNSTNSRDSYIEYISDPNIMRHVAIFRDNKFACSGVVTDEGVVKSAARCGYHCKANVTKSSQTECPKSNLKTRFPGLTVEFNQNRNYSEHIPDFHARQANSCDSKGIMSMDFLLKNISAPVLPELDYASITEVEIHDKLFVYGYSSTTNRPSCTLKRNRIVVLGPENCQHSERQFCAKYLIPSQACSADLGSPVYSRKDDEIKLVGVVTNITINATYDCVFETAKLVVETFH